MWEIQAMGRPKGLPKTGGGSRKGIPNKLTRSVKEAFEIAFTSMQDEAGVNLLEWGKKNPTEFYKISSKLIPETVNNRVTHTLESLIAGSNDGTD